MRGYDLPLYKITPNGLLWPRTRDRGKGKPKWKPLETLTDAQLDSRIRSVGRLLQEGYLLIDHANEILDLLYEELGRRAK
jgi:hypothetical protein